MLGILGQIDFHKTGWLSGVNSDFPHFVMPSYGDHRSSMLFHTIILKQRLLVMTKVGSLEKIRSKPTMAAKF